MVTKFKQGAMAEALQEQTYSWIVVDLFNKYGGMPTLKVILNKSVSGLNMGPVRLPLVNLNEQQVQDVYTELKKHGFLQQE